jgi:signal transduction histidine kinase
VLDLLEREDRLAFERGRLRFRLALLAAPALFLISYGPRAATAVALTCAVVLLSTAAIYTLLRRYPETLIRHQLWLRLVDVLSIFTVLTSARELADVSAGTEFYDAAYLLSVISATATHALRGTYVVTGAATAAIAAERFLETQRTGEPFSSAHLFTVGVYAVLFVICGAMVHHLMRTSGAVVARRDRAWEQQLEQRNAALERAASALRTSNSELEAFAYSVSHDLRAPLRSIDGFSRIVLDRHAAQLSEQAQDYLRRVRSASQRMGQLIDELLTLSRVSRAELRSERLDLSEMAATFIADLRDRQPKRRVEVVIQDGLIARGDTTLVRTVLENLIGNAWKFSGQRDVARIEIGALDPQDSQDGRRAVGAPERRAASRLEGQTVFYVKDNGAGFDMAFADKLFGAFQRLHSAAEFEGNGIGLATVLRVIRRHGGWVWATSEPDQGAAFYFTLPSLETEP